MKNPFSVLSLTLCSLLIFTACQTSQAPPPEPVDPTPESVLPQREQEMIEDIEYLREAYKEKHIEPFLVCSEEEFDFKLDQVKAKVNELSDVDFYYELRAALAGVGDIHTKFYAADDLTEKMADRQLPIGVQCLGGRPYLYRYRAEDEQFAPYLLREIVAVNGIDATYLEQKAKSISNPFNDWNCKRKYSQLLTDPAFLDWAGCDYKEGYTFQILNDRQEVESIEVPVITSADLGAWVYPKNWGGVFFNKDDDWAEYLEGENGGCVYLHYSNLRSIPGIVKSFETAGNLIKEHPECSKLVIDMRDHPGGDENTLRQVRDSAKWLVSPTIGQTYVITGGFTASAAIISLGIFQDIMDNVVIIGEPTGQFDSFLWAAKPTAKFTLPHSQHWGWISDSWYDAETDTEVHYDEDGKLYDWENTILPDVYVHQDIEDVRRGKDSVIEWVLAQ